MPDNNYKLNKTCSVCGVRVSNSSKGKCVSCSKIGKKWTKERIMKMRKRMTGENNPMFGKTGELSPFYGKKHTDDSKEKTRLAKIGSKNPQWIEGTPSNYQTIHNRIRKLYGKANKCENPDCSLTYFKYEWSNKDHKYDSTDRDKWQMLCLSCHRQYDEKITGRFQ